MDEAIAGRDAALEAAAERLAAAQELLELRKAEIEAQAAGLRSRQMRIDELEQVATQLSERVVEREQELRALKEQLTQLRDQGEERMRALETVAEEIDRVRKQARGQATRIRLRALHEAAELSERIAEMTRRPADVRERLIDSLQDAIGRIGTEAGETVELAPAQSNGHAELPAEDLFQGLVEVEVGPLQDFSQLVGFEDAAGGIGATKEISVTRFAQGRATLELRLGEPIELLRELEERAPFEFRVRDRRSDRLILDVDGE